MKIVNARYGIDIELPEERIAVRIIENKLAMREIVHSIWEQCDGSEGEFVLSEDKVLKIGKVCHSILNPFCIDFNNKKIISTLYGEMSNAAEEYIQEKAELNSGVINILDKVSLALGYSGLEYNYDFAWNDLFKVYGVKLSIEYDSLLEKLVEYIKLMSKLCGIQVVFLVNIKLFLSNEELLELYSAACYNKVRLVLIEGNEQEKLEKERLYIIDKDNCFIVK